MLKNGIVPNISELIEKILPYSNGMEKIAKSSKMMPYHFYNSESSHKKHI